MATHAVAREAVAALRRTIARIEGRLPETLQATSARPSARGTMNARREQDCGAVLRWRGAAATGGRNRFDEAAPGPIATGAQGFDEACGGGLPFAALGEIHAAETRGAGAAAGFALGLARRALPSGPVIWIGAADTFSEAGFPHAPGIAAAFGLAPHDLYLCAVPRPADALWVAEEAAGLARDACIILEIRGEPNVLTLTATRRLHRRAVLARHPVFLVRHACAPSPTAAPYRLLVAAAPSGERETLAGPLAGSLGAPRFAVTPGKGPAARGGPFTLEWNRDDQCFRQIRPAHPVAVPAPSANRSDQEAASRPVVALEPRRRAG